MKKAAFDVIMYTNSKLRWVSMALQVNRATQKLGCDFYIFTRLPRCKCCHAYMMSWGDIVTAWGGTGSPAAAKICHKCAIKAHCGHWRQMAVAEATWHCTSLYWSPTRGGSPALSGKAFQDREGKGKWVGQNCGREGRPEDSLAPGGGREGWQWLLLNFIPYPSLGSLQFCAN